MGKPVKLTAEHIQMIEHALARGERVELIPVKNGVKAMRVRREEIKATGAKADGNNRYSRGDDG